MKTRSPDSPFVPEHARNNRARRTSYFDDDADARYEAVHTHGATEGIIISVAIGILLWAFVGLGVGWL